MELNIKRIRMRQKITQAELARKSGISRTNTIQSVILVLIMPILDSKIWFKLRCYNGIAVFSKNRFASS